MSRLRIRLLTKRALLGVVLASALPAVAFAQAGGAQSSSQTGAASGHPMMGHAGMGAPKTTGANPMAGKSGGSPWVKSIQAALNRKEHAHLAVDGKMGPETRTALEKFQKAHGIKPTGRPNKVTEKDLGL
jgi:peptidoglycan hydrolase-like protein with peptidoglycan-binding domain